MDGSICRTTSNNASPLLIIETAVKFDDEEFDDREELLSIHEIYPWHFVPVGVVIVIVVDCCCSCWTWTWTCESGKYANASSANKCMERFAAFTNCSDLVSKFLIVVNNKRWTCWHSATLILSSEMYLDNNNCIFRVFWSFTFWPIVSSASPPPPPPASPSVVFVRFAFVALGLELELELSRLLMLLSLVDILFLFFFAVLFCFLVVSVVWFCFFFSGPVVFVSCCSMLLLLAGSVERAFCRCVLLMLGLSVHPYLSPGRWCAERSGFRFVPLFHPRK